MMAKSLDTDGRETDVRRGRVESTIGESEGTNLDLPGLTGEAAAAGLRMAPHLLLVDNENPPRSGNRDRLLSPLDVHIPAAAAQRFVHLSNEIHPPK